MVRIGTRGSKLALWQAHFVQDRLKEIGVESEVITIDTLGDKMLDVSISKIGSKGVFTEEIEQALRENHIDLAIHSAKDLSSTLAKEFELIAFSEREKENDVLVGLDTSFRPDLVVGTSSTRRVALFRHHYPEMTIVPVRGNLQTRMKRLEEGVCDVLALAYAGVHRMGYEEHIIRELPVNQFTPPVGQGSIAIEALKSMDPDLRQKVRQAVNHEETEIRLLAERAFLRTLNGGCSIPVFGYATLNYDQIHLTGGIISLDGQEIISSERTGPKEQAVELGEGLGNEVLNAGGKRLLEEIRDQL